MEGNESVYLVNPVSRITGEGRWWGGRRVLLRYSSAITVMLPTCFVFLQSIEGVDAVGWRTTLCRHSVLARSPMPLSALGAFLLTLWHSWW